MKVFNKENTEKLISKYREDDRNKALTFKVGKLRKDDKVFDLYEDVKRIHISIGSYWLENNFIELSTVDNLIIRVKYENIIDITAMSHILDNHL